MYNNTDIRFVNPHPKCIRANDNSNSVPDPLFLFAIPFLIGQSGMIIISLHTLHPQQITDLTGTLATLTIYYTAARHFLNDLHDLVDPGFNLESAIRKIGTFK